MAELKTLSTIDTSPFKRLVLNLGATPTAFTEGMTYYELLAWLVKFLEDEVVPKTNESIEGLKELQTYVSTYFDNLDVQEEINNKLDAMAEDGTLQAIIESYINLNAIIVYDNLAALKASEALAAGITVKTLGYHTKGDGGSAIYRIREVTNQDTEDDMLIVAITNDETLVAEFIFGDEIVPQQLGAYGDGTNEDSVSIAKTFEVAASKAIPINLRGVYYINNPISIDSGKAIIVNGSRPQIGSTVSGSTDTFANFKLGNDGYFETLNVTNVTFNNVGFNGTNKAIVLRSFRNRIINCGFNGFAIAISTGTFANWLGENVISKCVFNTVGTCIKLDHGSDQDIEGNLIDGSCTKFMESTQDAGTKFINNHDYSTQGSVITGYNNTFVGNYVDGWNKLVITGNSGFNITGNTFIGTAPESGVNWCIKFTSTNITSGVISGNNVANNQNNLVNEYLYFIDVTQNNNLSGVTIGNNGVVCCKSLFYGGRDSNTHYTIINQPTKELATLYANHISITSQNTQINGNMYVSCVKFSCDGSQTNQEGINFANDKESYMFIVKSNTESTPHIILNGNNRRCLIGALYNTAVTGEVWCFATVPNYRIPLLNTSA